jgi:hypothetical protein
MRGIVNGLILSVALWALLIGVAVGIAQASSLSGYRIWDAGGEIRERYRLCVWPPPDIEWRVHDRTRVEMADGADRRTFTGSGWHPRGCVIVTSASRDTLRFRGWYFGRLRVRVGATGEVLYTGWRRFWSS